MRVITFLLLLTVISTTAQASGQVTKQAARFCQAQDDGAIDHNRFCECMETELHIMEVIKQLPRKYADRVNPCYLHSAQNGFQAVLNCVKEDPLLGNRLDHNLATKDT